MARTIDPERHHARRMLIVDAALTCFAERGFTGATTADVCRQAGIGSGTFFHYFPTKLAVLLAILEVGSAENAAWFGARPEDSDPLTVLLEFADRSAQEAADPRLPGFVRAVGGVMGEPEVAAALVRDEESSRAGLLPWVRRAQDAAQVRTDLPAERLCVWLLVLFDGFLDRVAMTPGFDAAAEGAQLRDAVRRLLAPADE